MTATVYGFADTDGSYLYIGCTEKIDNRIGNHHGKPWWSEVAETLVLAQQLPITLGRRIERHMIEQHEPVHNYVFTAAWRQEFGAALLAPALSTDELAAIRPTAYVPVPRRRSGHLALGRTA